MKRKLGARQNVNMTPSFNLIGSRRSAKHDGLVSCAFLLVLLSGEAAYGQVITGIPPFSSMAASTFDTINEANLNVVFSIPILNKAGAGMPFTYALSYNNSFWSKWNSIGNLAWTPSGTWGWGGATGASTGYMQYSVTLQYCYYRGSYYYWNNYAFGTYYDPGGTSHIYNHSVSSWQSSYPCGSGNPTQYTATLNDSSGYTITVNSGPGAFVYARSGVEYVVPLLYQTGNGSVYDTNGNSITSNWFNGTTTFTDTLGATALTATGGPPGGATYTYTAPNSTPESVSVTYGTYTVQTNFGCSGISEFGPTQENLVSTITMPDRSVYSFGYEQTPGYAGNVTGRLATIGLPTGGTIFYSYSGGNNGITCQDGSTATLTRTTTNNGGPWVYQHVEGASTSTTTITYPDSYSSQTVITFLGAYAYGNQYEAERQVYQGSASSGTLLETVNTCYNGQTPPSCTSGSVPNAITSKLAQVVLPGLSPNQTYTTYNTYGLPTLVQEYDWGPSLLRQTVNAYDSNTSCGVTNTHVVDRPCSVTIENSSGGPVASTSYTYNANGNVLSVSSGGLTKGYTHNTNGTLATMTDVNNAQTTLSYGSAGCGAFPTTITPPAGPAQTLTWNCPGAVLASMNEGNGTTTFGYTDPFGRVTSITDPTNAQTNIFYTPSTTESVLNFGSNSTVDTLTNLDGLGRLSVVQRRQGQGSTSFDSVETVYDSSGRAYEVSPPYSAGAGGTYAGSAWNTTLYDPLNRPSSYSDSGSGSIAYSYSKNDVLVTVGPAPSGENSKRRQLEYNGLGQLTSVCEVTSLSGSGPCTQNTSANGFFTSYSYDLLNNLTSVSQSGQSRAYNYDSLGRLTSETNPESGTVHYYWDTCPNKPWTTPGDLCAVQDNSGAYTDYGYDPVHRLLGADNSNSSNCMGYFYDSQTPPPGITLYNTQGRVVAAYTNSACNGLSSALTQQWFSYSARGDITDVYESTPNSGGFNHVSASYWANGATHTLNLFNSTGAAVIPTITYNPDGEGRVATVSASSGQSPVTATTYNAGQGLPTGVTFGSGDSDVFDYDARGRMGIYQFNVNGQSLVGEPSWNPNGTLASLTIADPFNSANAQACGFAHDDLARISKVNCGGDPLANDGFERGNTGWALGPSFTIVNDPAGAQMGNWYMAGSSTTNNTSIATAASNGSIYVPVTPGEQISFGGWIKRVAGTGILSWNCGVTDSNYNVIAWCPSAQNGDGSGGTAWQFYTAQYTIPAGAVYILFFASVHCCGDSDASLTTGYFDSAFFEGASLWSQAFTYDQFGNLSKNGTISFQPTWNPATNRPSLGSFDSRGNLQTDTVSTYTWDPYGNLASVANSYVGTINLAHDANGRMVEQGSINGYTQVVYGPDGSKLALMNGQSLKKAFVPLTAGAAAVYNSVGLAYYRHPDWLGSSRLASTPSRTVAYDGAYAPYGENYAETGTQDREFAGMNQDTVSAGPYPLYDGLYREYHPTWGRWLNPDPTGLAAVDPSNPQSWNRYAYVTNNPLALTDPLGLLEEVGPGCVAVSNGDAEGTGYVDCPSEDDESTWSGLIIYSTTVDRLPTQPKKPPTTNPNSANNGEPCPTGFGAGILVGIDAGAGAGFTGAGGNASAGAGLFGGNGINAGAFASGGVGANFISHGVSAPATNLIGRNFLGGGGGVGGGIFLTNASQASQLSGHFGTWNVDLGWLVNGAAQFAAGKDAAGNTIWTFSFTLGGGGGFLYHNITTNTVTKGTGKGGC